MRPARLIVGRLVYSVEPHHGVGLRVRTGRSSWSLVVMCGLGYSVHTSGFVPVSQAVEASSIAAV